MLAIQLWLSERAYYIVFALLLLAVSGCDNGMPATVVVRGKVMFDGKELPGGGSIFFTPLDAGASDTGLPRRPATADFGPDGVFTASSYKAGDGLVPGTYRLRIFVWKTPPAPFSNGVAENLVPSDYQPPDLVVDANAPVMEADYDIPTAP